MAYYRKKGKTFSKVILRHGKPGDKPMFITNTKATFHYRSYRLPREVEDDYFMIHSAKEDKADNNAKMGVRPITEPDAPIGKHCLIDDTRAMNMDPVEIYANREFKLEVWEDMVKTMKVGEIARFSCPSELVEEYPRVSKALRDMYWRKTKKIAKQQTHLHVCSISMLYGTGHADLDALMSERVPVIFEVELLKVEQPGDYKMDNWAMSEYDKKTAIPKLKEEGNKHYEEGDYVQASENYFEALCYVEERLHRERRDSAEWLSIVEQKVPLLLNYAQCLLLKKEYAETIRQCSTVLEYRPDNVKALFRRGKAYAAVWDVKEAERDLNKAVELDPSLAKAVEKELKAMQERVKEKDKEERERLKGKLFK